MKCEEKHGGKEREREREREKGARIPSIHPSILHDQ
jgi:hypothetical protein